MNAAEVLTLITPTLAVLIAAVAGAVLTSRRSNRLETTQAALYAQGRDIHVLVNNRLLVALQAVQRMAEALERDNPDDPRYQFAAQQARDDVANILNGPMLGEIEQPVPRDSLPVQIAKVEAARQDLRALPVVPFSARDGAATLPAVAHKVDEVSRDLHDIQAGAQAREDAAHQATYEAQVATADAALATSQAKAATDAAAQADTP